ncbi:protein swallow [Drosophila ficusphila]|uniref:protein swallow n=1 Tax=Drosophila ficusphila TaxID=30025 RepID=UPI0007E8644E|nr:protein swallow [Drosophila ficusphila]
MSIEDESFPSDELFDQLNNLSSLGTRNTWFSEHHQPAAFERNPAPFLDICYTDADGDVDVANKSDKTCVSDPVGRDQEDELDDPDEVDGCHGVGEKAPLGSARSSKAVSYQDIHSAYTKRRYKHVKSKVRQYIADIDAQDQKRRNASASGFQRHSSMPEYLTPNSRRVDAGERFKLDNSHYNYNCNSNSNSNYNSNSTSSCSYERLLAEVEVLQQEKESLQQDKETLQTYKDQLQFRLDEKIGEMLSMKFNYDALRSELSDCQQKLRRHQSHSLRSLNFWPPAGIDQATQTDPFSAVNTVATPGDLTYNSSDGSIEMVLLSAAPTVRIPQNPGQSKLAIPPKSLDFSNDSTEADASGNGDTRGGSSSLALVRRDPAPNSSETSQPSSNDSAIECEGHEEERPSSRQWVHREGIYYFDKRHNRVIEVLGINLSQDTSQNQSINDSQAHLLIQSMTQSQIQAQVHGRTRRTTLGSRMLRLLGPCVRCKNGDQLNASTSTFTVGLPLTQMGEFIDPRNQR